MRLSALSALLCTPITASGSSAAAYGECVNTNCPAAVAWGNANQDVTNDPRWTGPNYDPAFIETMITTRDGLGDGSIRAPIPCICMSCADSFPYVWGAACPVCDFTNIPLPVCAGSPDANASSADGRGGGQYRQTDCQDRECPAVAAWLSTIADGFDADRWGTDAQYAIRLVMAGNGGLEAFQCMCERCGHEPDFRGWTVGGAVCEAVGRPVGDQHGPVPDTAPPTNAPTTDALTGTSAPSLERGSLRDALQAEDMVRMTGGGSAVTPFVTAVLSCATFLFLVV